MQGDHLLRAGAPGMIQSVGWPFAGGRGSATWKTAHLTPQRPVVLVAAAGTREVVPLTYVRGSGTWDSRVTVD